MRIYFHQSTDEISDRDIEAFIIPGGDISAIQQNERLVSLLKRLNTDHKYIGAICSGVDLLKQTGLLEGKRYTSNDAGHSAAFKVHDNLITAKANGYVDFAIALGQMRGIYSDEADYEETIRFFKYFENA